MWTEKIKSETTISIPAKDKYMLNVINTRLYPACHSGDIQAINAGSSHVHINLQYKNVEKGKGKWLVNNHSHQTQQ